MQARSSKALDIFAIGTLLAALVLSAPVLDRAVAAAWQWFKFAGHSNDGHITLSLNTGIIFSSMLAAVFVLAFSLNHRAKRRSATRALACSRWAMYVVVAAAVCYWLLGMSNLNAWRA